MLILMSWTFGCAANIAGVSTTCSISPGARMGRFFCMTGSPSNVTTMRRLRMTLPTRKRAVRSSRMRDGSSVAGTV